MRGTRSRAPKTLLARPPMRACVRVCMRLCAGTVGLPATAIAIRLTPAIWAAEMQAVPGGRALLRVRVPGRAGRRLERARPHNRRGHHIRPSSGPDGAGRAPRAVGALAGGRPNAPAAAGLLAGGARIGVG